MSERINIVQHSVTGGIWLIGWLFTIGFLQLSFWQGTLALLLWPYTMGYALSGLVGT